MGASRRGARRATARDSHEQINLRLSRTLMPLSCCLARAGQLRITPGPALSGRALWSNSAARPHGYPRRGECGSEFRCQAYACDDSCVSTERRVGPRSADGAVGHCWRVGLAVRLGVGAAILATGSIALISTAMRGFPISDPLTMIALYAAFWWFGIVRPAVWLSSDELVVRNPLWTHRIARENVVSARPGSFGMVISRLDGRSCSALALYKPQIDVWPNRRTREVVHAAGLITYWAQIPRSSSVGEAPESLYAETPGSRTRRRVVEIVAAAGLAIALTIPAVLLAWPDNSQWLWPVAGLILLIALVLALTSSSVTHSSSRRLK